MKIIGPNSGLGQYMHDQSIVSKDVDEIVDETDFMANWATDLENNLSEVQKANLETTRKGLDQNQERLETISSITKPYGDKIRGLGANPFNGLLINAAADFRGTAHKLKKTTQFFANTSIDAIENLLIMREEIMDAAAQGLINTSFQIPGVTEPFKLDTGDAEEQLAEKKRIAESGEDPYADQRLPRIGEQTEVDKMLEPMASFFLTMFAGGAPFKTLSTVSKGIVGGFGAAWTMDLEDGNLGSALKNVLGEGGWKDLAEYLDSKPENAEIGYERLQLRVNNLIEEGSINAIFMGLPLAFKMAKAMGVKFLLGGGATVASTQDAEGSPITEVIKGGLKVISSRLPTAVNRLEDPLASKLSVNLADLKKDEKLFDYNVKITQDYPNMQNLGNTGDELSEQFVDHVKNNLLYLYDETPELIRARSKKWYEGANSVVNDMAARYGIADTSVSGVMASLSPQKDWYQNASLGMRTIEIVKEKANEVFDPKMVSTFKSIKALNKPAYAPFLKMIEGKKLGEVVHPDPKIQSTLRSIWVRMYDETYNDKSYKILSPEGEFLDNAKTLSGENAKVSWGSLNEITKALDSIDANGDMSIISQLMGMRHKVRNFFNNISDPNNTSGDVTIDTHAVAGGLFRPLSGKSLEVDHNFKNQTVKGRGTTKGSALSGIYGNYPLYVEAYQRAARERGVLPREMQSITWEASRGLFTPAFKSNAKNVEEIDAIWYRFKNGEIDESEARKLITDRAGGINLPEWAE